MKDCKICIRPLGEWQHGTGLCDVCWEADRLLDYISQYPEGRRRMRQALRNNATNAERFQNRSSVEWDGKVWSIVERREALGGTWVKLERQSGLTDRVPECLVIWKDDNSETAAAKREMGKMMKVIRHWGEEAIRTHPLAVGAIMEGVGELTCPICGGNGYLDESECEECPECGGQGDQ